MNQEKFIFLVRHGQAYKNINKRHGGEGSSLTEKGKEQANNFAQDILNGSFKFEEVLYSPKKQCYETASIFSEVLGIPLIKETTLKPISLGIIDGMSESEVEEKFPKIDRQIKLWRKGNLEINDLHIPEMEDKDKFYKRGEQMIDLLVSNSSSALVVMTRSLLVLLTSILLKRTTHSGGNYREIKWDNLGHAVFSTSIDGIAFHVDLSTTRI